MSEGRRTKVLLVAAGVVLGFGLSEAIQSALAAHASSTIKRSMANAVAISDALEAYKRDNGRYPELNSASLSRALIPKYLRAIPGNIYTGQPYSFTMNEAGPAVVSVGRGGFIVRKHKVVAFEPYRAIDRTDVVRSH
jgi:hypothetical protein